MNENSMLYWYPKIEFLDIPQPDKIEVILVDNILELEREHLKYEQLLDEAAKQIEYPLFMRTDHTSAKHSWNETCYVEKNWRNNIGKLLECSLMADLPVKAIIFRSFIEMDSVFTAFRGAMPINPEQRYFIVNGEVICNHAYWIEDAVLEGNSECVLQINDEGKIVGKEFIPKDLPDNWKELLESVNTITFNEEILLISYTELVADQFPKGGWSVDFCRGKDKKWYLIDMAVGWRSWHPGECDGIAKVLKESPLNDS